MLSLQLGLFEVMSNVIKKYAGRVNMHVNLNQLIIKRLHIGRGDAILFNGYRKILSIDSWAVPPGMLRYLGVFFGGGYNAFQLTDLWIKLSKLVDLSALLSWFCDETILAHRVQCKAACRQIRELGGLSCR